MTEASKNPGNVFQVELNPVESFNFMFKNLWFANIVSKLRINILDTILFHEGEPLMWLFTSEQTGEIMKKKADKITSTKEIVKVFKSKANSIFGLKTNKLKPKIAIIWYFESITKLSSYLVNEPELTRVLNNKLTEIVAIQVYLGGLPLKGNGLFEHTYAIKMPTINHYKQIAQPAQPIHSTYEHIDSIYSNNNTDTNYFTSNNNNKLHITEHQHDAIRHICNKITHFISNNAYGNISITNISIQVVFNSQWIPYVVSASNITVSNAPQEYITHRELMVFPAGRGPTMPHFTEQSLHLPIHWTEHNVTYQDSEVMFKTAGPFAGKSTGGVGISTNNTVDNNNESNSNKNNNNHNNSSHVSSEQHPLKQKDWYNHNDNNSNNNSNNNNNAVLPQVIPLSGRSAQSNHSQISQTSKNSKNSTRSLNSNNNNSNSNSNSYVNRQLFGEQVQVIDTIIDAAGAATIPLPAKTIQAIQHQQQQNKQHNHNTATNDNTTLENNHNNQNTTENKSGSRSDSPLHRASTSPLLPSQMLLLQHDSNNKPFSQHSSFDSAIFSTVSHNNNTHSTVGSELEVNFHNGYKHNHIDKNDGNSNNTNNSNNSSNNNNNNSNSNNINNNIGDSNGNIPLSARSNNNNNIPHSARSVNSKNNQTNQVPIAVPQSPKSPKQVSIYTPADTTERHYTGDNHTNNHNNKVRPQSASSVSVNSNNKAGALRNIVHNNRTSDTSIPVPTAISTAGNFAPVVLQSRTQGSRLTVLPVRDSRPSTYHFVNHIPNVDLHKQITGQVDSSELYDTTSDVQNNIFNSNNEERLAQLNALELQQKQQLQQIQFYKEQMKDYKSVLQHSATTDTLLNDKISHNNKSNNNNNDDIDNEMQYFNNTFNLADNSNNNNTNNTIFTTGNNKNKKQLPSTDHRYMDTTETAHLKQSFYKLSLQDQHNAEKELAKVFNKRRPISAPHTRQKSRMSITATANPLTSSGNNPMEWTFAEKPEHEVPGAGILKVLPLSGVHCFGDYCQFIENRNKDVSMLYSGSEHHNNINSNNPTQSTVYNQSTHTPLTQPILIPHQAPTFNNHFPQQIKSTDCPHKLSYKSILLSRAEESFIGTGLDDKFDSLWDQIKLSNFTTEQLIAYFVKRHLNRVAVKCQEEGRVMSYNSNVAPMTAWNALNKVYRKMVYAKALSHVHPSRFYYTVPLCEVCFRIYSFMDTQRDLIVLHNPTNSQLHSNSQHLQHLNSTDNMDDNNDLNNGASDNKRQNNANNSSGNNIHTSFRTNNNNSPLQSPLRTSRSNDHSPVRSRSSSPFRDEFFDIPVKDNTKVLIHRERDQTFTKHNHSSIKTIKESTSALRKQENTVEDVAYLAKYEKHMRVVPENYTDHDKLNLTLDRGIGSRGPIHSGKQVSVGINIKGGRVSSWVKLMRQSAESNHSYGSDFQGNTAKRSKPKGVRSSREKKSNEREFEQQHSNANNTGGNNINSNSSNEYKNNNNSSHHNNNQAAVAPQFSNRNAAALHSHAEEQQYVRDRNNNYNNDARNDNNHIAREPVNRNQTRPQSANATTAANTTPGAAGTIQQRMNKSKSMVTVATTATAIANANTNNNSSSSGMRQRLNKTLPIRKIPTVESTVLDTPVRAEDNVDTVASHLQQQFEQQQQQSQQQQQQNLYLQQHANNPYVPQNNKYTNNPIAIIPPLHYMHNPLLGNLQPTLNGANAPSVTVGNGGNSGGIIDEYAFSCLPFMAAPFLPVMQTKNASNYDANFSSKSGSIVGGSVSGNHSMKSGIADV